MKYPIGTIVKYRPEYCSDGEEKYRHVIKENRLNPVTNEETRYIIQTINMEYMHFCPSEEVEECMIEKAE